MMFLTFFIYLCFFAVLPHSDGSEEQVTMWPWRDGRFFIGLFVDTYWCGSGNVSRGLNELGPNYLVDACCRSHDLCDVFIDPGETKYNVRNNGRFTISSCDCNAAFHQCLTAVNSHSSAMVFSAYASTYPDCLIVRNRIRCRSPANNYNQNPCKGFRNSENLCSTSKSSCEIYDITDEGVIVDSIFKINQLHLDKQKPEAIVTPNGKKQSTTMLHRSHQPPPTFLPNVYQLVHGSP